MALEPAELYTITRHAKLAQVLYALATLGVPDLLADGPKSADEIAAAIGAKPDRVERLLRTAAGAEVLGHLDGRYVLTDFSRQLCSGSESSFRDMLIGWSMLRPGYVALGHLDRIAVQGGSGIQSAYGQHWHDYLDTHPDAAREYSTAMESTVDDFVEAATAYDFSQHETIVDVGGGMGGFLVAILRHHSTGRGIDFDLPRVTAGAPQFLAKQPERDRIEIVSGDMFTELPQGADAYIFSTVLRCFEDDECLTVLRSVANAMAPSGRVIALEMVMSEGIPSAAAGLADLYAMAVYGGKDRTRSQWAMLLAEAGFGQPEFHAVNDTYSFVVAARRPEGS